MAVSRSPLRIVFAGTPEFAARHLEALIDSEHQLIAVYTQPDRPAGRGKKMLPGPVKQLAVDRGLPVRQPASLRDAQEQQALAELGADLMLVVAYGLILPTPRLPQCPCFAVASLAGRGTDSAGDRGGRHRNRHHYYADGCRPGHWRHAGHCPLRHRRRNHRRQPA